MVFGRTQVYGLTRKNGSTDMNDIVKTLKVMCKQDNPQDQKLLLLAELVETKCEDLAQHQSTLQECLNRTNDKLDKVTSILEKIENDERSCPVHSNRKDFEKLSFIVKYPKLTFFMLVGVGAVFAGLFGTGIWEAIKFIF